LIRKRFREKAGFHAQSKEILKSVRHPQAQGFDRAERFQSNLAAPVTALSNKSALANHASTDSSVSPAHSRRRPPATPPNLH
jgi:hypothetical protein